MFSGMNAVYSAAMSFLGDALHWNALLTIVDSFTYPKNQRSFSIFGVCGWLCGLMWHRE
jgi:hypothetical protein